MNVLIQEWLNHRVMLISKWFLIFCRHLLHHCFQALMDHGATVADILADTFAKQLAPQTCKDPVTRERSIQLGFQLGNQVTW